jgi:hypothetical protein
MTICALTMCSRPPTDDKENITVAPAPTAVDPSPAKKADDKIIVADKSPQRHLPRCAGELEEARKQPAMPGTPKLDEQRASVVARNKGEPVVFIRAPKFTGDASAIIQAHRRILERTRFPADFFRRLRERQLPPELLRSIVLKEGYVYGETLEMAAALCQSFVLRDLFSEPEIWIDRGSERLRATKGEWGKYYYADGPDKGSRARLFNFDRVGVAGQSYGPPLQRDVRTLMHDLGFDRMRIEHITDKHVIAALRYDDVWVPSLMKAEGPQLKLECEVVPSGDERRLTEARARIAIRQQVLAAIRQSILLQVREKLPFDEPETEWGQEDGALFLRWQRAYDGGRKQYRHHFDRYPVFTENGQPRVPQVCVDFLTHTLERASGTWWAPEGSPPKRFVGGINFDELMGGSRRRVPTFINFIREHPEKFDLKDYIPSRHPYKWVKSFFRYIDKNKDDFQPGDMVFIFGRAPWDHYNVPHYHSFIIYEADPVTGMPILLASNAGKPRVRSWEPEMNRAPLRGIRYRVRPNIDWLAKKIHWQGPPDAIRTPPPLVASIP